MTNEFVDKTKNPETTITKKTGKMWDFIPGEHEITAKEIGTKKLFSLILKTAWCYKRTMLYILKNSGYRNFISFLYTKVFVPTGAGAGGAAYYFVGPLVRRFPQLYRNPICIEIETSTRCNKKCILCEHTYWKEKQETLSLDEFKHIIDQIPTLRWFGLTGEGDPLLNPDFIPILRYAKSKSITVWLDESFDLLNEDISKHLVDMKLDGIMWSLDAATKEVYETFKIGCNLNRTIEHVKALLKTKKEASSPIPEIIVRSIVSRHTLQEMPKIVDLVSELGEKEDFSDAARIQYIGVLDYPEIHNHYLPEFPPEIVSETKRRSEERDFPVIFAHTEPGKFPSINKCLNWMEPYVFMKGYVVPCCVVMMSNRREYLRKRAFGNVFDQPFKDIWNSMRYRKFRKIINKPDAPVPQFCVRCRSYDTRERIKKFGVERTL
jgi:MoaA/NifB/PqqE/SkfB family radical SAM enzyme